MKFNDLDGKNQKKTDIFRAAGLAYDKEHYATLFDVCLQAKFIDSEDGYNYVGTKEEVRKTLDGFVEKGYMTSKEKGIYYITKSPEKMKELFELNLFVVDSNGVYHWNPCDEVHKHG